MGCSIAATSTAFTFTLTPNKPTTTLSISFPFSSIPLITCKSQKRTLPLLLSPSRGSSECALSSSKPNWVEAEIEAVNASRQNGDDEFIVVNFYRFVFIKDPEEEVFKHLSFLQGLNIHGRIYLNEQGINAQYSGPSNHAVAYANWLKGDNKFSDILFQISPSPNGHAFPRLKLRYKPSLVQLEGGVSHLPLLDPSMRATPLTPSQWSHRLEEVNKVDNASNVNLIKNCVLLDVRNGYEWDIGHFLGAQRPDVDCFRSTSFGLSQSEAITPDPLASVDKEKTDILMYCTGGIRCDVYSAILSL